MSADNGLWYVKTPDGDVNPMTLDDLDEAFNAGRIDENVMVLPAGESTWARLGVLLGLDEPAPAPVAAARPAPFAAAPNSLRPVSLDLSDDFAPDAFRKKSRKGVIAGAMVGVLAIAAVAVVATRGAGSLDSTRTAAAAVAQPAPAPPPPVVAATPAPVAAPAPPAAAPPVSNRFSEDQKAKLSAADKALADKAKAHKKARGAAAPAHATPKYKSQGFTSGGNKYDPLNAN